MDPNFHQLLFKASYPTIRLANAAIPVNVPEADLDLEKWRGHGLGEGEETLPDEQPAASAAPAVDQDALEQLMAMGFTENRCRRAITNTGNSGAEAATEWLFTNMDDPSLDDPLPEPGASGASGADSVSSADVEMLTDMGFSAGHAKRALKETVG